MGSNLYSYLNRSSVNSKQLEEIDRSNDKSLYFNDIVSQNSASDRKLNKNRIHCRLKDQETKEWIFQNLTKNDPNIQIQDLRFMLDQTLGATDKLARLGPQDFGVQKELNQYSVKVAENQLTLTLQTSLAEVNQDIKKITNLQVNNSVIRNLSSLQSVISEAKASIKIEKIVDLKEMIKKALKKPDMSEIQNLTAEQKRINIMSTSVDENKYYTSMSNDKFQTMKTLLVRQTYKRPSQRLKDTKQFQQAQRLYFTKDTEESTSINSVILDKQERSISYFTKKSLLDQQDIPIPRLVHHVLPVGLPRIENLKIDCLTSDSVVFNNQKQQQQNSLHDNQKTFQSKLYQQNKEFLQPFKQLVIQELKGQVCPDTEETVQLQNSLGVLTLYQDICLHSNIKKYQFSKNQYFAVPQKSLTKSELLKCILETIMDTMKTKNIGQYFPDDVLVDFPNEKMMREYMVNKEY